MTRAVKPRRRYESPRRREQADATRQAILDAAERLFGERGFAGASVAAIAGEARVSLKTIYAVFGTKAEVVRALWNLRLRGDDDPAPLAERPWVREALSEPDPARRLELVARNTRAVRERTATVTEIVRHAAPGDADIGALWDRFQREFRELGMRPLAEGLARDGALAVDADTATDLLWTLCHPDVFQLLVGARGWSPDRYQTWLADSLKGQLLR